MGNIYYMDEYISFTYFIKSTFKCFYQLCGKFSYKTDCIT